MKRVVIDTSVLVRAFLKKTGGDWEVYEKFLDGEIEVYYSQELIDEFLNTIKYPRIQKRIGIKSESVEVFLESLLDEGKLKVPKKVNICRDVRDNHVIGLALRAAGGQSKVYLITHDEDILVLRGMVSGVEILRLGEFLELT